MAGSVAFFGLGRQQSLPHSPKVVSVESAKTGPPQNATIIVTFDRNVSVVGVPALPTSDFLFWVDDVPIAILNITHLTPDTINIVGVHGVSDGEVFCVQCPRGAPNLIDDEGNPLFGFNKWCDTYVEAVAKFFDLDGKLIEKEIP